MIVNVVAALALFFLFGAVGIAAATSLAAWVNTIMLARTLARRGQLVVDAEMRRRLPLLALASLLMGVGLFFASIFLSPWLSDPRLVVQVVVIAALVAIGLALFALFSQLTGAVDLRRVLTGLRRRPT
jgi:putative peptidoglycan lipid II flippase